MKWNQLSRRMFLRGAGNFTLAMPLLPSLMPRELWGATPKTPLRYIGISSELGYSFHTDWFPNMDRPSTKGSMPGEKPFYYQPLSSYAPTSNSIFSPIFKNHLAKYYKDINIYRGLDMITRFAHGPAVAFGNLADNTKINNTLNQLTDIRTIDQVLNDNRKYNPAGLDSMFLGFYQEPTSWMKDAQGKVVKKPMSGTPTEVFNRLFSGIEPSQPPGDPLPPTERDPLVDVLGRVFEDYKATRNNRALSSADKIVLDTTADRLNDLQKRLNGEVESVILAECNPRRDVLYTKTATMDDLKKYFKSYVDVIVMAMCCDITRTAMFANGMGSRYDFMNNWAGLTSRNFHDGISHNPRGNNDKGRPAHDVMVEYNELAVTQIMVPLMDQMSNITDTSNGKSLLYNSIIHLTQESALNHSYFCHPVLLAGHAGGALKTGYLIDYMDRLMTTPRSFDGDWGTDINDKKHPFPYCWPGLVHNRLFATILQGLGLVPEDYRQPLKNAVETNGGYGYINANTYLESTNYPPENKSFNKGREAQYDMTLSG